MKHPDWNKHPYLHKLACIIVLLPFWFIHSTIEAFRAGFKKYGRVWSEIDDFEIWKYPTNKNKNKDNTSTTSKEEYICK